jgi:hypothetical protein
MSKDWNENVTSLSLDTEARELVAQQAEAVAKVEQARAEFEKIKAELLRTKTIPVHVIVIGNW